MPAFLLTTQQLHKMTMRTLMFRTTSSSLDFEDTASPPDLMTEFTRLDDKIQTCAELTDDEIVEKIKFLSIPEEVKKTMTLMTALPLFTALMMYYAPATLSVHISRPVLTEVTLWGILTKSVMLWLETVNKKAEKKLRITSHFKCTSCFKCDFVSWWMTWFKQTLCDLISTLFNRFLNFN